MNKVTSKIVGISIVIIVAAGIYWISYLQKAHSTFENYYAFRECNELVSKNDECGICRTKSGTTIKIVKYQGKWYLDGDLPCGFLCF